MNRGDVITMHAKFYLYN